MNHYLLCTALAFSGVALAKRHSREHKFERFERRAQEATKDNTPLSLALNKRTKAMTFDEASLALTYYREKNETEMIIKCGERILAIGGDQEVMRQARLDLARAFLALDRHTNAIQHANDYLTYYPGAHESKDASYIATKSLFLSQCHSYRDQRKTKETIEHAEKYLEKYPHDVLHKEEIQQMLEQSYLKLIRSEMNIVEHLINMYLYANRKGALTSAHKRVAYIKEQYIKHAPHTQYKLIELEISLAQAEQNKELIAQKKQELTNLTRPILAQTTKSQGPWQWLKSTFVEDNQRYFA